MRNYKQISTEQLLKDRQLKKIKLGRDIVLCFVMFAAIIINL